MMAALTATELLELWASVVDVGYSRPFLDGQAAGVDTQFEAYEQVAVQLARASEMIERSYESMFLLPWSGQVYGPATGAQHATVVATVTRTDRFNVPLTIPLNQWVVEEVALDWGPNGGVEVLTGRRFTNDQTITMGPGEAGPFTLRLIAERPGFGYNMCEPGSLSRVVQPGAGLANIGASVVPGVASHRLVVAPEPDVVVPELVGQFIELTVGLNASQVRRVIGYEAPHPTGSGAHGGVAVLAATGVFEVVVPVVGAGFEEGEEVVQRSGVVVTASGVFRRMVDAQLVIDRTDGDFVVGLPIEGVLTGTVSLLVEVTQTPNMVAETPTVPPGSTGAGWRVLAWHTEMGVAITTTAYPTRGSSAMLDELGDERKIHRQPAEPDDSYRVRIARVADAVSPNAIRRIANRIFVPLGGSVCLREVGSAKLPGLYFDCIDPDPRFANAFDLDMGTRPQDRHKLLLDYTDMRAFFLLGAPPIPFGDFGCAFDDGQCNAFDASPFLAFFDGFPITSAVYYRTLWAAVDAAKAAGVGFDVYVESLGCF